MYTEEVRKMEIQDSVNLWGGRKGIRGKGEIHRSEMNSSQRWGCLELDSAHSFVIVFSLFFVVDSLTNILLNAHHALSNLLILILDKKK